MAEYTAPLRDMQFVIEELIEPEAKALLTEHIVSDAKGRQVLAHAKHNGHGVDALQRGITP